MPLAAERCSVDKAFELAHIAWPGVLNEAGEGHGAEPVHRLSVGVGEALREVIGEQGNVFATFAEGRHAEANGGEASSEIRPKRGGEGEPSQRMSREAEYLTRNGIERANDVLMIDPLQQIEQARLVRGR